MPAHCTLTDLPTCLAQNIVGGAVSSAVPSLWDAVCRSFADAATQVLQAFGKAFAAIPDVNPASAGITSAYGIALAIGGTVVALLVFGQVLRTAWTHDGSGLAQALTGTARAFVSWLLTAAVATAALAAADQLTRSIVAASFGSQQALAVRLGNVVNWSQAVGSLPGQAALGASLLLILALAGIVLVIVLWFELLLRNAALAVLIAVAPIAAAGQAGGEPTRVWWTRTVSACAQLIILKPVIALVFAVGFGMAGQSQGVEGLLAGLLVLALAAFAWPVIARFFTFATIQATSSGLAAALGFAAGSIAGRAGGQAAGVSPGQFSRLSEERVMAGRGAGAGTGGGATAGGGSGGSGGGSGASVAAGVGWGLQLASRLGTIAAGRMEQTAAHAGMHGAYPYSTVSGGQHVAPRRTAYGPASGPGPAAAPDAAPAADTAPAATAPPPPPAGGSFPDAAGTAGDNTGQEEF